MAIEYAEIAIQVSGITKIYDSNFSSERETDEGPGLSDIGKIISEKTEIYPFVALDNVSFNVNRGDVLGIIGKNGSGKSTLLKILSEVMPPTSGEVRIKGSVASLLEIGTGFHPDISGRENIYMNGLLLGMNKASIKKCFDEIVHFSGIGDFIDVPVKKYSSGMFLRLAFSVMVNLEHNILLLDEILSVGDADFRLKSYNKIRSLRGSEKTLIIVSHDLGAVSDLCNKCLVLDKGKLVQYGPSMDILSGYMEKVIIKYQEEKQQEEQAGLPQIIDTETVEKEIERQDTPARLQSFVDYTGSLKAPGNDKFRILKMSVSAAGKLLEQDIGMDDEIEIAVTYQKNFDELTVPGILISSPLAGTIMALTSERPATDQPYFNDKGTGNFTSVCSIPRSFLNAGIYSVTFYYNLMDEEDTLIFYIEDALSFKVNYVAYNIEPSKFIYKGRFKGPVYPLSTWRISNNKK